MFNCLCRCSLHTCVCLREKVKQKFVKPLSHIRDAWSSGACFFFFFFFFFWCDELTQLSFHTACDKTVFSTLSDLYVCSQVRNMSYASEVVDSRAATRQCEYIIKIYSVLIFPLVALLHRSTHRSPCERTFSWPNCNLFNCRAKLS